MKERAPPDARERSISGGFLAQPHEAYGLRFIPRAKLAAFGRIREKRGYVSPKAKWLNRPPKWRPQIRRTPMNTHPVNFDSCRCFHFLDRMIHEHETPATRK